MASTEHRGHDGIAGEYSGANKGQDGAVGGGGCRIEVIRLNEELHAVGEVEAGTDYSKGQVKEAGAFGSPKRE